MASEAVYLQGLLRLVDFPDIANGLRARDPARLNFGLGVVYADAEARQFQVVFPILGVPTAYPADAFVTGQLKMQLSDAERLRPRIEALVQARQPGSGLSFAIPRPSKKAAEPKAPQTPRLPSAGVVPQKPIAGAAAPERRSTQTVSVRSADISASHPQLAPMADVKSLRDQLALVQQKLASGGARPSVLQEAEKLRAHIKYAEELEATQFARTAAFSARSRRWDDAKFGTIARDASAETIAGAIRSQKEPLGFTYATQRLGLMKELVRVPREKQRAYIDEIAFFDKQEKRKFESELAEWRKAKDAYEYGTTDAEGNLIQPEPPGKSPIPATSILIVEYSDGSRRVVNLREDPPILYPAKTHPTEWATARLAAILMPKGKMKVRGGGGSEGYELRRELEAGGERFRGPGNKIYVTDTLRDRLANDASFADTYFMRMGKSAIQKKTEILHRRGEGETATSAAERMAALGVPVTEEEVAATEQIVRLLLGEPVRGMLAGTESALPRGARLKKGEVPTGKVFVGADQYAYIGGTTKKFPRIAQAKEFLRLHGFPEPVFFFADELLDDEDEGLGEELTEEEREAALSFSIPRPSRSAPAEPGAAEDLFGEEEDEDEFEGAVEEEEDVPFVIPRPRKNRRNPQGDHPLTARALVYAQRLAADPQARQAVQDPSLLVGKGGNASVYALPRDPDLVVRVEDGRWSTPTTDLTPSVVPNLMGACNVGQPLARTGNITILLRQYGFPAGMMRREPAFASPDRDDIYVDRIRAAAAMPQSAYDQVARDLLHVNAVGLQWDPSNSNNILIDPDHGRFGLVDLSPQHGTYAPTAAEVVTCLVGNTHAYAAPQTEVPLRPYRKLIIQKMMQAADNVGLPRTFPNDSSFAYSLKLAGLA